MATPTSTETNGKAQMTSPHLAAARELLGNLDGITSGPGADPQVQASAAVAHSVLVLAEQVAAARVLMFADKAKAADGNGSN